MAKDPQTSQRKLDEMVDAEIYYLEHEKPLLEAIVDLCEEDE